MPLENLLGDLALDATLLELLESFRARYAPVLTAKATYETPGVQPPLVVAAADEQLQIVWIYAQAAGALGEQVVEVTVTLGARSYTFELTGSQPFAHGAVWQGGLGEDLVVTTSSAAKVYINVDYRTE